MDERKYLPVVVNLIVFLLAAFVLSSGRFDLPQNVFLENPLDHFYLIMVHILFWLPGAYLINKIIDLIIWKKIIVLPVGSLSIHWIQNFISSLIYITAVVVILKASFFIGLTVFSILILFLLLVVFTFIKPKALTLFKKESFQRNRQFNKGDWITIKNADGQMSVTGEVYNFDHRTLTIKNEDNNLVFITSQVLASSIIENYWSFKDDSRFCINISLDAFIPVERGKRILYAAALNALEDANLLKTKHPEILIDDINESVINYKIYFWMKAWKDKTPSRIKDIILNKILFHADKSGAVIKSSTTGIPPNDQTRRSSDFSLVHDRVEALRKIEFFDVVNESELELLAGSLKIHYPIKGEKIIVQGDGGDSMFVIIEGLLNVKIHKDGGEIISVGKLIPGDFFGEMSLFTGEPRSASVEVYADCLVFELTKESLKPILHQRPDLVEEFGKVIAERQSYNEEIIAQAGTKQHSLMEVIVDKIKSFFRLK